MFFDNPDSSGVALITMEVERSLVGSGNLPGDETKKWRLRCGLNFVLYGKEFYLVYLIIITITCWYFFVTIKISVLLFLMVLVSVFYLLQIRMLVVGRRFKRIKRIGKDR